MAVAIGTRPEVHEQWSKQGGHHGQLRAPPLSVHPTGQPQLGFPPKKTMFISSGPWLLAPRSFVAVDLHTARPPSPWNERRGRGRRIGIRSITF